MRFIFDLSCALKGVEYVVDQKVKQARLQQVYLWAAEVLVAVSQLLHFFLLI